MEQVAQGVRVGIDSGSAASVLPENLCTIFPVVVDSLSRWKYRSDSWTSVTRGGDEPFRTAQFRVANVSRPFMCVADMDDQAHEVAFDRR